VLSLRFCEQALSLRYGFYSIDGHQDGRRRVYSFRRSLCLSLSGCSGLENAMISYCFELLGYTSKENGRY
jgi:hypothetical protein